MELLYAGNGLLVVNCYTIKAIARAFKYQGRILATLFYISKSI